MVVYSSAVNGGGGGFWSRVREARQPETVAQDPPREHQRGNGGKPARESDPDADALPVAAKRKPRADPEADDPVTDQREDQRPTGVVQAAQHPGADDLRSID